MAVLEAGGLINFLNATFYEEIWVMFNFLGKQKVSLREKF